MGQDEIFVCRSCVELLRITYFLFITGTPIFYNRFILDLIRLVRETRKIFNLTEKQ